MKRIVLLFAFLAPALLLQAQQVILTINPATVDANDVIDTNDPFFEIVGYATVTNVSDAPLSVRWQRLLPSNLPLGWEVLVCDNVQCYPPFVSSNIMPEFDLNAPIVLAPGATSNLDVHVRPNQFPGSASIRLQLTAGADTTVLASGSYNISAVLTSSSNYTAQAQDVKIFPNPASDYFQLSPGHKINRVVVYNTLGRQVRAYDAYDGRRYYSLAGLADGMYLVSLFDSKGMVKTLRLIKRGFRP